MEIKHLCSYNGKLKVIVEDDGIFYLFYLPGDLNYGQLKAEIIRQIGIVKPYKVEADKHDVHPTTIYEEDGHIVFRYLMVNDFKNYRKHKDEIKDIPAHVTEINAKAEEARSRIRAEKSKNKEHRDKRNNTISDWRNDHAR